MNKILAEWIEKAEDDYAVSKREMNVKDGSPNAVCFHSQQLAEKYFKAFLFKNEVDFPKTHDLIELLRLSIKLNPSIEKCRKELDRLQDYAVLYRYPGASADSPMLKLHFGMQKK